MRNFFLYILAAAGMFYVAVLYNSRGFLILAGAAVLLPPFFLYQLWSVRKHLESRIFLPAIQEESGNYCVCCCIENKSPFYLADIRMEMVLKSGKSGTIRKIRFSGRIPAGEKAEITGMFRQLEFGLWQAECRKCFCYDCLGIFRLKKKWKQTLQFTVLPSCYETTVKVGIRTRLFLSDGSWYHPQTGGDDPTEILKLREYREGDRMNRIHWKLSAKNEELIVSEMSMPMGCNVVVFLDGKTTEMDNKTRTAYWEVLNTISQELLAQECFHYLVWYDRKEQRLQRRAIRKSENLAEFWTEILQHETARCQFRREYEQEFRGEFYVSAIQWNQELELYCNDKFLVKITPKQVEQQLRKLELMV